jgi:hypothetical protein
MELRNKRDVDVGEAAVLACAGSSRAPFIHPTKANTKAVATTLRRWRKRNIIFWKRHDMTVKIFVRVIAVMDDDAVVFEVSVPSPLPSVNNIGKWRLPVKVLVVASESRHFVVGSVKERCPTLDSGGGGATFSNGGAKACALSKAATITEATSSALAVVQETNVVMFKVV